MQKKHYVIDTNVLLDDPDAITKLQNGMDNEIYIPYHVIKKLDKFKKDNRLSHIASKVTLIICVHANG